MPKVKFSNLLARKLKLKRCGMEVAATNLKDLFDVLENDVGGVKNIILSEEEKVRMFIAIFLNGERVEKDLRKVSVKDDDQVWIINIIAGG